MGGILHAVWTRQVRIGVWAGLVAGAATAGALAAFAGRAGDALRPFRAMGAEVLLGRAPAGALPVAGLLLHLAAAIVWGVVLGLLVGTRRGLATVILAAGVAAAAALAHTAVLPMLRLGYGLSAFPLHGSPVVFLYVVFAVGLAVGLQLARSVD